MDGGAVPAGATPPSERWGALGTFLAAQFYVCVLVWLGLFVAVPVLGLGFEAVVVTSGSMQPGIRAGDVVLLREPDDRAALAPGTVVTFRDARAPDVLTTHRIASVNADGTYRTRGDANADLDSTALEPERIVGVARLLVPLIGLPVTWLDGAPATFTGWAVVTVVACAVAARAPRDADAWDDDDDRGTWDEPAHGADDDAGVPVGSAA